MRASRIRILLGIGVAALAAAVLPTTAATAAPAGDVSPPYVIYGVGTLKTGLPLIARIPGSSQRVVVSESKGFHFLPSASLDGSVVSYITIRNPGQQQTWSLVIRKDGVVVERQPFGLVGGVLPSVSDDGSTVVTGGANGLKAFDVARGRWRPLCPACPELSSSSTASLSPDGRMVAVGRKILGSLYIEIRRISDGRRVAIASTGSSAFAGSPAWNATSDTVAYVYGVNVNQKTVGTIRTLTVTGVDSATKFADTSTATGVHYFTSPKWIDGEVWAIESIITPENALTSQVVTAASWKASPVAVGAPLYQGKQLWRAELLFIAAWTNTAPTAAHR